jgi:LemA protein
MKLLNNSIVIVAFFLVVPALIFMITYNGIVDKNETVNESWAQVESNYQRRADLIPNLIGAVSQYMQYEAKTFEDVAGARSGQLSQLIDALTHAKQESEKTFGSEQGSTLANNKNIELIGRTQRMIDSAMYKLVTVVESYPELRSSEQMMSLQAQLEGTENRINVARVRFNRAVQAYNRSIRSFPGSFIAEKYDLEAKPYFKAGDLADKTPIVSVK